MTLLFSLFSYMCGVITISIQYLQICCAVMNYFISCDSVTPITHEVSLHFILLYVCLFHVDKV